MYEAQCIKTGFRLQITGLILLVLSMFAFAGAIILGTGPAGILCFLAHAVLLVGAVSAYHEGSRLLWTFG